MNTTLALFLVLLSLHPRAESTVLMRADQEHIVRVGTLAAEVHHVPVPVLLAVGYYETWLGTHPGEGGNWGAPRLGQPNRHIPGTADDAATVLERSFAVCHSWEGAITRFRSGLCSLPPGDARLVYVQRVGSLVRTLMRAVPTEPILWRVAWEEGVGPRLHVTTGPPPRDSHVVGGDFVTSPDALVLAARRASPRPGGE